MMKSIVVFITALLFYFPLQAQNWLWSKRITDSLINRYITLTNPTWSGDGLIATDAQENIIHAHGLQFKDFLNIYTVRLAKYDRNGNLLWLNYFEQPGIQNQASSTFSTRIYDLKVDRLGNIYMLMRNFTRYDSINIPDGNTQNCLVKIDAQGKLLWKKPVGAIEAMHSAPQFVRITPSPEGTHLFALFDVILTSVQFLDSVYTRPLDNTKMVLCRIDSSGRLEKDLQITGARSPMAGGLDVNEKDEVLITGSASLGVSSSPSVTIGDTTFNFSAHDQTGINFLSVITGSNLSRKWTKVTRFPGSILGNAIIDAKFMSNGNIGFLSEIARSETGAALSKAFTFGSDTVSIHLPNLYENPYMFITNPNGKLLSYKPLSSDSRMIIRSTRLAIDKLNNFYIGGSKAYIAATGQERWRSLMIKLDPTGNLQWMNPVTGVDSVSGRALSVPAAQFDYPVFLTTFEFTPKAVFGPDTISTPDCFTCDAMVLTALGGRSNAIRGQAFLDFNNNHQMDAGEDPLPNLLITSNDGAFNTFTDYNGNYVLVVDSGTHVVKTGNKESYRSTPSSYTVIFNGTGQNASAKNFAIEPSSLTTDVSIDLTFVGIARPATYSYFNVTIRNNGTLPASGNYKLILDGEMRLVKSHDLPVSSTADSATWSYTQLMPAQVITNMVTVLTDTTATFGSVKKVIAVVDSKVPDTLKENNTDTAFVTIRGSYDPNDKLVYPFNPIRIDSVQTGKKTLEYTIRFQNTGNDTAFLVHITDTLSSKLNFSTIKLLASSHPVEVAWTKPNVLHFYFRNILLPDSNVNEPRSHGFAKFSVQPKTTLTLQDSIENSAAIYFDYNAPVITNKVVTLFRTDKVTQVNNPGWGAYQVKIYPNPTRGILLYSVCCFRGVPDVQISVIDFQGKELIREKKTVPGETLLGELDVKALPAGIYLLKMSTVIGTSTVKFVKL